MKIGLIMVCTAIFSLLSVGCGDKKLGGEPGDKKTKGEWVLESWNGSNVLAGKVYLKLDDGKFSLYQSIDNLGFKIFSGDYTIVNGIITGLYGDGAAWDQSYTIQGEKTATMVMVGVTTKSVAIYSNTTIPDYVKDGVIQSARSDLSVERFL